MILTDPSEVQPSCNSWKLVQMLEGAACKRYITNHMMNVGMYQIHSDPQKTEEQSDHCFLSFHRSSAVDRCLTCLRTAFMGAIKSLDIYTLTKFSLLIAISELALEAFKASIQTVVENRSIDSCNRIQVVPQRFCYYHQHYLSTLPPKSTEKIFINTFFKIRVPVGVWPPQNHNTSPNIDGLTQAISSDQLQSDSPRQTWSRYSNIALVH